MCTSTNYNSGKYTYIPHTLKNEGGIFNFPNAKHKYSRYIKSDMGWWEKY